MTLISTTDALAIGTAAPASSAISAAGLIIMAEVARPTLHIPHPDGRASGQVGSRVDRVHLLLTGPGLHIAGIPSWAAMLAVLAAHRMGQLAAGPAPTQAWAAGLSHWAAGALVTAHVSGWGQGSPVGRPLLLSDYYLASPLTPSLSYAHVALGTAVLVVGAADSLWNRTAAPLPRHEPTAGGGGGTAGDVITEDIILRGFGA